jgi:osmoprotectant transport system ATP-binding protein
MIKLENVYKKFPDGTEAVKNLTFEIEKGDLCIFLGPSGCGKTTSMKMINRIIPMTSGKIFIDNKDILELNPNELRRDIGYAIQNIGLFPHLTVKQNILTVPILKKWPAAKQENRVLELLDLVGMDPKTFMNRYPSELSGGQQQRIGVARALGADPPVLLMDEPFGAIDPITRSRLQDEFLKIQDKLKKTIAFVTHDINEAIKMGDKIALMKKGELIQFSTPADLLNNPKNEFVRNFVGTDRFLKGLRLYKVRDVMEEPKLTFKISDNPARVKSRLEEEMASWGILIDEQSHFIGWIIYDDLNEEQSLDEIYEPGDIVSTGTPLNEALSMMFNSALGNLAVLGEKDKLIGILSFDSIKDMWKNGE